MTQINDALAGSDELIKKLYSFLDADSELNPLLASFFSKVMGLLITRKSEMVRQVCFALPLAKLIQQTTN